jgi:lipoate-protein ligase B
MCYLKIACEYTSSRNQDLIHCACFQLQGITTHGVALNVGTDLDYFKHIVACGVPGASATSLESELQRPVSFSDVTAQFTEAFATHFGYGSIKYTSEQELL